MPDYRAPGVYVEEIPSGSKPIEGVSTSTAALVCPTRYGPLPPEPTWLDSYMAFERQFGRAEDLTNACSAEQYGMRAAQAFFDNGGSRLCVMPLYLGEHPADDTVLDAYAAALQALETVEEIGIVLTPGAAALTNALHLSILQLLEAHCRRTASRIGLVDLPRGIAPSHAVSFTRTLRSSYLAAYHPWLTKVEDSGRTVFPPSGAIAGILARNDGERGVHAPAANLEIWGIDGFDQAIGRTEQAILYPAGINCLRAFPTRGHLVWGARSLSDESEWKYINVRRYAIYVETSISRGTRWVVFEPNGESLWQRLRNAIENFLHQEWRQGALAGRSSQEAYFVKCDHSTMTRYDIENGQLVCLVGIAPVRPAEFVIVRIAQKIGVI